MLSVNVPPGEVRGVRVTRQSRKITQNVVYEDPPGSLYYWQDETVEWRGWRGVGRNTNLELPNGRRCALHEGDMLAVVFGAGRDNERASRVFMGHA